MLISTLSIIQSESRKTGQVTMKANFIHTWRLESEFGIKNLIFPWTSELAWIWHFFEKIWFFLITLALATLWQNLFQTYGGPTFVEKTLRRQFCNQMLPVQECSKKSQIFSKNAMLTLTLMSKEKLIFLFQIQILTFKYVWNLLSLSLAQFFLIQNELRPGWDITNWSDHKLVVVSWRCVADYHRLL